MRESCPIQFLRLIVGYKLPALLADAQLTDDLTVTVRIVDFEIVQQTTTLAHQH